MYQNFQKSIVRTVAHTLRSKVKVSTFYDEEIMGPIVRYGDALKKVESGGNALHMYFIFYAARQQLSEMGR